MSDHFQGVIQKVSVINGRLVLRCVRTFFPPDGFLGDDVWVWDIERPEEQRIATVRTLIGTRVEAFEVKIARGKETLLISIDEDSEPVPVVGANVRKKAMCYNRSDLLTVIDNLSKELHRAESLVVELHQRSSGIEIFIHEILERSKRRLEFEQHRESSKVDGLRREIGDLEAILRRLKGPGQIS
jgi:hypothetical protein